MELQIRPMYFVLDLEISYPRHLEIYEITGKILICIHWGYKMDIRYISSL